MIRETIYTLLSIFVILLVIEACKQHKRLKEIDSEIQLAEEEAIRSGIYLRGFIAGAAFQETYRHSNPNTNENPMLELDVIFPEEQKAYDQTFKTNKVEKVRIEI
jgi:hypothetical protein